MKLISLNCKNCNATLSVDPTITHAYCQFCGSVFLIDHEEKGTSRTYSATAQQDFEIKAGVLVHYNGNSTTPVIPYNVRHIGKRAFAGVDITSITIPSSVVEIEQYAFSDCNSLTEITIPSSVKSIGNRAFWRCFNLSEVVFDGSPSLGDDVFLGTPFWDDLKEAYRTKKEAELSAYRIKRGLCPYCGGSYSLFGVCKRCGSKKN